MYLSVLKALIVHYNTLNMNKNSVKAVIKNGHTAAEKQTLVPKVEAKAKGCMMNSNITREEESTSAPLFFLGFEHVLRRTIDDLQKQQLLGF